MSHNKTSQKSKPGPFDELFLQVRRETMKTAYIPQSIRDNYEITYDYARAVIVISPKKTAVAMAMDIAS